MAEFQQVLREKASLDEQDFAALQLNQPVVRLFQPRINAKSQSRASYTFNATAEDFLRSYRDSMLRKATLRFSRSARFGPEPALADLESLTLEAKDIEDLKDVLSATAR